MGILLALSQTSKETMIEKVNIFMILFPFLTQS